MLSFALKKNEYQNYNGGKRKIQSKLWKITWRRYLKKKKSERTKKEKIDKGKKIRKIGRRSRRSHMQRQNEGTVYFSFY